MPGHLNPLLAAKYPVAADRQYFDQHLDEDEYIREFCPGEFSAAELPEIPPGFRYATCVSRLWRGGEPVGRRYRSLMTVCDAQPLQDLIRASP
jgi:hypothetical protein